ncbi:SOS response-associated peptidase [Candidatus Dojkabacteria bacterium]|nr:SOS response-associated peptidase [Candidatus Dojkabacteria bacterium]
MCYRYYIGTDFDIEKRFSTVPFGLGIDPNLNASPSHFLPIIRGNDSHEREITIAKWGFIPKWAKDDKFASKMANARSETVDQKPSFKNAFRSNRCIVPVSGFYEWKDIGEKKKVQYSIEPKDGEGFGLAGLWSIWDSPQNKKHLTFTILTTEPTKSISSIHHRMPVILERKEEEVWLEDKSSPNDLVEIFDPYPDKKLEIFETSK